MSKTGNKLIEAWGLFLEVASIMVSILTILATMVVVHVGYAEIKELKQTQKQLIIKIKNDSILHSNRLLQHQNGIKLIDSKN